jgi:hypothetical protein
MIPLDDEFLLEEARQVALELRKTTSRLVRDFTTPALQVKLKAHFGD